MELEATAQALAPEAVSSEPVTTEAEPDYSAAYDKAVSDEPVEAAESPVEAIEAPEAVETAPAPVDVPTDIPAALRSHWATIPEEARGAILNSQREMARNNAEMGRLVKGIAPIRDVLTSARDTLPALMHMKPEEVALEVVELAKISADFRARPLETFLALAQKHNMTDALKQALGGQQRGAESTAAMQTELRALKEHIARTADPEFIREQVSAVALQERTISEVTEFASGKPHWAEVEAFLPDVIKLVQKAAPESPSKDVLARAYDLAVQTYRPDLKAPAAAAVEAVAKPDPDRTQAAIQAKSVNVPARTSGKPRELTEDEAYSAVYDRAARK